MSHGHLTSSESSWNRTRNNRLVNASILGAGIIILSFICVEFSKPGYGTGLALPDLQRSLKSSQRAAIHKDLYPLDRSDIVGTTLVGIGLMIAASGGVGGGGILVPLLIIVFGFHPKYAIPLSNFTILGSSVTNMILNLPKRHPDAQRPLVDWDLILVMEPVTMAGAVRYDLEYLVCRCQCPKHRMCIFSINVIMQ